VVFERISFYFHFDHSDVRIKQYVLFRYRNESKIRPQKRIAFMHVDITNHNIHAMVQDSNEKIAGVDCKMRRLSVAWHVSKQSLLIYIIKYIVYSK
jgi:hypothetical protein